MPLYAYRHQITVPDADIDDLGHVNNAAFVRYLETVARAHAESLGFPMDAFRVAGAVPVVRRHEITYHRPAYAGERLWVSTEITRVRGVRATRHNEVRRVEDDVLLVDGDTEWVWLDPERGRPRVCPEEILRAFGWPPAGSGD